MVLGGSFERYSVELLSLAGDHCVPGCLQKLPNFPDGEGRESAAGAALLPGGMTVRWLLKDRLILLPAIIYN